MSQVHAHPEPWTARAACQGAPLNVFFDGRHFAAAKALCGACPVRQHCLEVALTESSGDHGLWGGSTRSERRAVSHLGLDTQIEVLDERLRAWAQERALPFVALGTEPVGVALPPAQLYSTGG